MIAFVALFPFVLYIIMINQFRSMTKLLKEYYWSEFAEIKGKLRLYFVAITLPNMVMVVLVISFYSVVGYGTKY